ncbi:hypothetical protein Q1695_008603 [Nippostrongylus brasiliensis]|nr:hypothetical protein Q1695_008603 [Nippostrongylus brasiliensis]
MSQPEPPQREPETDPLNAFDNEPGLPKFIPRKFVEQLEFAVEWAADESDVRQFKVTSGRLIVAVPSFLNPPLEFGDYLVSVNNETMKSKMQLYQTLLKLASRGSKESKATQIVKFSVERVISAVPVSRTDPDIPQDLISNQRCDYFLNTLVFFPRSSLGINIKSVNKKVYVESTDNGFNSIARRAFYIGDALLVVNGSKCTSVKQASSRLITSLKTKGIARILIERPVEPAAVAFVRAVLLVNKKNVVDPKMPDDAVLICKNELARMRKSQHKPKTSILKEDKSELKSKGASVTISETATEVCIGAELLNPALLEASLYIVNTLEMKRLASGNRKSDIKS